MGIKMDFDKVRRDLRQAERRVKQTVREAGDGEARNVFIETKMRVPKETGALLSSGNLSTNHQGTFYEWIIKYGNSEVDGVGVDYAAAVHERRAVHASPTGTKYVEGPLMESVAGWRRAVARAMKEAMG